MEAAILAHGQGSRIRSLTGNMPKTLLKIGGVPILKRTLGILHGLGIERVTIIRNPDGGALDQYASDEPGRLVQVKVVEPAGSLHAFAATEAQSEDGVIILDSDLIFDPNDLQRLLSFAGSSAGSGISMVVGITAAPRQDSEPVQVLCGGAMKIEAIGRKLTGTPYVLAGMYVARRSAYVGVDQLLESGPPSFVRYLTWAADVKRLLGFAVGGVQDVDCPEDIEAAEYLLGSILTARGSAT